jgi:ribose transport system ATP-binding protein
VTTPVAETSAAFALEMVGVSKRFAGVQALKDVSLSVRPGEVLALIGENGAGKSTLMKCLGGVHHPDSGEILVRGESATIRSVKDSYACGIAFIHQELNVIDNLDVAGNVFLGREPLKAGPLRLIDRARMRRETQPFLDALGLSATVTPDMPLTELALAQQQMVEIAKALSLNARVLIMDEPTSSLTLSETDRLLAVVKQLAAQSVSVIYISHRLGEILQIADRVVALRDGRNAGELSRDEITHDAMVRLMVGRDIESFFAPPLPAGSTVRLSVKDLRTRRYPAKSVSFDLNEGEILGMAGLVGAGRSEVAQAIFGVDPPLGGSVTLLGKQLQIRSAHDAIDAGIYLAPEDRKRSGIITAQPIRENVSLPALFRYTNFGLISRARESAAAEKACASLHVKAPDVEFIVGNLSGGNQQKVVLAKWLNLSPKVLICDEPTRGIDVGAKAEIYELLRSLAKSGVAILMISSDMEEVLHLSDRIAVMHEGEISGFISREEATEEAVMELAVGKHAAAPQGATN